MESSKVYVNVMAEFTNDGRLLPRSFIWPRRPRATGSFKCPLSSVKKFQNNRLGTYLIPLNKKYDPIPVTAVSYTHLVNSAMTFTYTLLLSIIVQSLLSIQSTHADVPYDQTLHCLLYTSQESYRRTDPAFPSHTNSKDNGIPCSSSTLPARPLHLHKFLGF